MNAPPALIAARRGGLPARTIRVGDVISLRIRSRPIAVAIVLALIAAGLLVVIGDQYADRVVEHPWVRRHEVGRVFRQIRLHGCTSVDVPAMRFLL